MEQALRGELDSWAATPRGRIALIILIDQFTRSIYRDSPRAFAGDVRAQQLSLDGLATPYPHEERQFLLMPLLHAEAPARRRRGDLKLQQLGLGEIEKHVASAPEPLRPMFAMGLEQSRKYLDVIARFGRFPHRNAALGRTSTPEEQQFLRDWSERQPPSGMRK